MAVLANPLFGPQFYISQHFDLFSNVTADIVFLYNTHSL